MKTIFDKTTSDELIDRINKLDVNSAMGQDECLPNAETLHTMGRNDVG